MFINFFKKKEIKTELIDIGKIIVIFEMYDGTEIKYFFNGEIVDVSSYSDGYDSYLNAEQVFNNFLIRGKKSGFININEKEYVSFSNIKKYTIEKFENFKTLRVNHS